MTVPDAVPAGFAVRSRSTGSIRSVSTLLPVINVLVVGAVKTPEEVPLAGGKNSLAPEIV